MSKVDNQYSAKDEVASVFIKELSCRELLSLSKKLHSLLGWE